MLARHKAKGGLYRVTGKRLTKINGEWVETIDYVPADGRSGEFGREVTAFRENFELVKGAPPIELAGRLASPGAATDLHAAIMNLPAKRDSLEYKEGHRDARHAAAELAMVTRLGAGNV
jgi:hypothetical protein